MKNNFKPVTIVFKVSDNIKEMMIKHYEDMKCEKTPPYAIFQVKDFDCVTTLYESGKVMFQGIGADIEASFWTEQERVLNGKIIDISSKDKKDKDKKEEKKIFINDDTVGSDEVGTGDFFGPLVVTASFVSKKDIAYLTELGVRDSKKLTDDRIMEIGEEIIKKISHTTIVLSNKEYNDAQKNNNNMNKIKAVLHNKCLLSVIEKEAGKYNKIVVDQFEPPRSYYGHLSGIPKVVKNITFMTKAEDQCMSVAASSIISRYIFLKEMKRMSKEIGVELPLGAGVIVDEVGSNIVKNKGDAILYSIAKMNFKNTDKIKEMLNK